MKQGICPKCGCQIYDPFKGETIIHDIEKCNIHALIVKKEYKCDGCGKPLLSDTPNCCATCFVDGAFDEEKIDKKWLESFKPDTIESKLAEIITYILPKSDHDKDVINNYVEIIKMVFEEQSNTVEDDTYILITFPDVQEYMEEEWFDEEAILEVEGKFGSSAYFIPTNRIKKI